MKKLKVKNGDEVIIIVGNDKGKKGKIIKVFPMDNKVLVSGINIALKHTKPTQSSNGGIVQKELPINISNIACVDPKTGQATKVGYKVLENGLKVRVAKKSGEILGREGN